MIPSCSPSGRAGRAVWSRALVLLLALPSSLAAAPTPPPAAPVATPVATPVALPAAPLCTLGKVVVARNARIDRPQPGLEPGPLFALSGSFEEKPVDLPCDPGQSAGPVEVSTGGTLHAKLSGSPPAPNTWSLYNNGVSLWVAFEPLLGEGNYGPPNPILSFAIPALESEAEMGGSWEGPGRLSAVTGAPGGSGPLTGSCFGQSYSAAVEVVEVLPTVAAQPGVALIDGDTVLTGDRGYALIAGTDYYIDANSEVRFESGDPFAMPGGAPQVAGGSSSLVLPIPEWMKGLPAAAQKLHEAGLPMPAGYDKDPDAFWRSFGNDGALDQIFNEVQSIENPCEAAIYLKLAVESRQADWTLSHLAEVGIDTLSIVFLPNEVNSIEAIAKKLAYTIPGIGYAATARNLHLGYKLILNEIARSAAAERAHKALKTFRATRGWTPQQLADRQAALHAAIDPVVAEMEGARAAMEAEVGPYREVVENLQCGTLLTGELGRIQQQRCPDAIRSYWGALNRAVPSYEALLRARLPTIAQEMAELSNLTRWTEPVVNGNCAALIKKPPPAPAGIYEHTCIVKGAKLIVGKGVLHVFKEKYPLVEPVIEVLNDYIVVPDGTEFEVEVRDLPPGPDTPAAPPAQEAIVRLSDGALTIAGPQGDPLRLHPGEQVRLPGGEVTPLEVAAYDTRGTMWGIPLASLPLDSRAPEPYATTVFTFAEGALPAGWVWQETDPNYGPGNATYTVMSTSTISISVPHDNELWGHRMDAPRLLHKVTGDFDLEADMRLFSPGGHYAYSEFVTFSPDTPMGFLRNQMNADFVGANYFVLGGGWSWWNDIGALRLLNRKDGEGAPLPDGPARVRLSRRGALLKSSVSLDGGDTWLLSSRQSAALPETIWAGWVFKRVALDGAWETPAVTTLGDIRLRTGPRGALETPLWETASLSGTVIPIGPQLFFFQEGDEPRPAQVWSSEPITGDFDLIATVVAPPLAPAPGVEQYLHVAVTSSDERNHAYVRHAVTPDFTRVDADMAIAGTWFRYRYTDTVESGARLRLARVEGAVTASLWQQEEWKVVAAWPDRFDGPVYVDLRYQYKDASATAPRMGAITIERLETGAGLLIGPEEGAQGN